MTITIHAFLVKLKGKGSNLIAVNSHFGWIICGDYENYIVSTNLNSVHMSGGAVKLVKTIEIQRHVMCCDSKESELHGFCDASTVAYGAVVYTRSACAHGLKVSLWTAKSCVVPSKEQTVPRLELLAAVLLLKLIVSTISAVERVLKVTNIFCWCDSQIVLWWLKLQKEWKLWVQNGVRIVRRNVSPENWFHVPTNSNPADVATRVRFPRSFSSYVSRIFV